MTRTSRIPINEQEERSDVDIVEAAKSIFADDIVDSEGVPPSEIKVPRAWRPAKDDFTNLQGKAYLGARKRILWMRGTNPAPHPEWTVEADCIEHVVGKRINKMKVEGGYALFKAWVKDETGRVIATGHKSEYSENFPDYLEKAETGSMARALAVAGYGTESALEFDEEIPEGASEPRIADAPVAINITPSNVPGIRQGGRSDVITTAQLQAISRLSREKSLGAAGLAELIDEKFGGDLTNSLAALTDDTERGKHLLSWLKSQSFEQAGLIIQELSKVAA